MAVSNSIRDLMNETAWQQAQDARAAREDSIINGTNRNIGGVMGKHDFLILLAAQLRHQDPLNPQSDSEFASQLAQFSSLEQMQNMNETLTAMAGYQAYSLVGKYVIATAVIDIDGKPTLTQIPGIVDSIFTRDGLTFAQIGEYVVPISAITDVFDSSSQVTPDMLISTSSQLIGRTVIAQVGEDEVEGIVTRVLVDKGVLYAVIDDGTDTPKIVPVGAIYDIRQTVAPVEAPATKPEPPIPPEGYTLEEDGDGYYRVDAYYVRVGRYDWDEEDKEWIYTDFNVTNKTNKQSEPPIPPNGYS